MNEKEAQGNLEDMEQEAQPLVEDTAGDTVENGPDLSDTESEPKDPQEPVRTSPLTVLGVLIITLAAASGGTWYLSTHPFTPTSEPQAAAPVPSTTTPPLAIETPEPPQREEVVFPRQGFSVTLPDNWRSVPPTLPLPTAVLSATHAFALPGTTCTIAHATLHTEEARTLLRQSAGYIELKNGDALIGRIERQLPLTHTSTTTELMHSNAPFLPHEFAFSYQPLFYDNGTEDVTRNAFILFAPNGTQVNPTCQNDFTTLLASISPETPERALYPSDAGVLTIERTTTGTVLLFRDGLSNTLYRVAQLSAGAIVAPTLTEDTLYYIHNSGALHTLPLFGGSLPSPLPVPLLAGESVNDFLVTDTAIEYLRGPWCRNSTGDCELVHESLDLTTYAVATLDTEITTPTLIREEPATTTQSLALENDSITEGPTRPEGITPNRTPIALP